MRIIWVCFFGVNEPILFTINVICPGDCEEAGCAVLGSIEVSYRHLGM